AYEDHTAAPSGAADGAVNASAGSAPQSRLKATDKGASAHYDGAAAAAAAAAMSQQHSPYQLAPPHYQQQPPPHYAYTGQFANKSAADDYAADPLPFEYHGVRKYTDTYAPHHHQAAYTMPKAMDARQQQPPPHGNYPPPPHYQPHPSDRSHYHPASEMSAHFPHASHHGGGGGSAHMFSPQVPLTHSFPPLLDPKKETGGPSATPSAASSAATASDHPYNSGGASLAVSAQQGGAAAQEAMIKVKTPLKNKYWRNGRRNLQCFPSCKVFGDYSAIKIEDLKQHDFMWGKCRGSIVTEVTLNSTVSFDDLVILGRVHSLENIPVAFEEAVIRECMLGRMVEPDVMDAMKDQWISGERLPDFVQQDGHSACFEFKPKVWKYTEDMAQGKCKRRNVKYYVQFEAFVLVMAGERRYYACIGSGMSTSFEVGSSRVLARQKRKAATSAPDDVKSGHPVADLASVMQPMLHHHAQHPHPQAYAAMMGPPHAMMGHPQAAGMFQSTNFHQHQQQQHESMAPARGLPAFPQMHPGALPAQSDGATVPPAVGTKRKAGSDHRPAGERAAKLVKPVGVPQSVPL
ncbi:hypothetical protein PybrP1_012354, partial [[Pythium] brassicae (nom. inval.)]